MEHLMLLVERHGLLLVWGNVFLAQAGLPLPVAPTLLVAGAFAAREALDWPALLAGAVVASLIADYAWYVTGMRFGNQALQRLYRTFAIPATRARSIEGAVARWGAPALFVAKFIPGLALVAPPIAGALRLRPTIFLAANGVAAAVWAGAPLALGAYHQQEIHRALALVASEGTWIAMLAAAALCALIVGFARTRRAPQEGTPGQSQEPCVAALR